MFAGKVVWITGASSGIGEEMAYQLAAKKARLILSARRATELERVREQCCTMTHEVEILPLDLFEISTLPAKAAEAEAIFGRMDMVVHSGGISQRDTMLNTIPEAETRIMHVNFTSVVAITRAVLPGMIARKEGRFVLMSSVAGKIGVPNRTTYSATKHALIGYFDALRAELTIAKHPVYIHIMVPGFIRTNISIHAVRGDGHAQGVMDPGQDGGMPVEKCVRKMIHGIEKNKREVLIGGKEILMTYFRRFIPGLYYYLITRVRTK